MAGTRRSGSAGTARREDRAEARDPTPRWIDQDAWEPTLAARMLKAEPRLKRPPASASRRGS